MDTNTEDLFFDLTSPGYTDSELLEALCEGLQIEGYRNATPAEVLAVAKEITFFAKLGHHSYPTRN